MSNRDMELSIEAVSKRYGRDVWGLRDFSLALEPGVLGLLGANGAGKSTLMTIIATITQPTEGRVLWNDVSGFRGWRPRVNGKDYLASSVMRDFSDAARASLLIRSG